MGKMRALQITTRVRCQDPLLHLHGGLESQSPPIGPLVTAVVLSMTLRKLFMLTAASFRCEDQEEWMMEV